MGSRSRTGIYVARVWYEGDLFRARVQFSADLDNEPVTEVTTASPAEVVAFVDRWLRELKAPGHEDD